jgi:hypothetical protein
MAINRDVMMIDGGGDFEPTPTITPVPADVPSVPVSSVASFRKAEEADRAGARTDSSVSA